MKEWKCPLCEEWFPPEFIKTHFEYECPRVELIGVDKVIYRYFSDFLNPYKFEEKDK